MPMATATSLICCERRTRRAGVSIFESRTPGIGSPAGIRIARALGELVVALAVVVKAWNFVDEAGQPLPCNLDGLKRLPKDLVLDRATRSQAGPTVPKG